jgi:hypothetical protein
MNKQKWIILLVALAMIGGAAATLIRLKAGQKLGSPGIKTAPIADSGRLDVYLPEHVLDFNSVIVPTDTNVFNGLPHDTSFVQRQYVSPEGGKFALNIVLMGADRTSMHKPEFCLPGAGWNIDRAESSEDTLPMQRPHPYDLPVMKLLTTREVEVNGEKRAQRGIFLYWFVADHELAGTRNNMLWKSATHLLTTGELQRWAYVGCLTGCWPGEEQATYERMKKFLAAAVPEFQLVPSPRNDNQALSQATSH